MNELKLLRTLKIAAGAVSIAIAGLLAYALTPQYESDTYQPIYDTTPREERRMIVFEPEALESVSYTGKTFVTSLNGGFEIGEWGEWVSDTFQNLKTELTELTGRNSKTEEKTENTVNTVEIPKTETVKVRPAVEEVLKPTVEDIKQHIRKNKKESNELLTLTVNEDYKVIEVETGDWLPELSTIFTAYDGFADKEATIRYEGKEHYSTVLPGEDEITAIATDTFGNTRRETILLKVTQKEIPVVETPSYSEGNQNETVSEQQYSTPTYSGGMTYYSQYDGRWANVWINGVQFGPRGCGPTTIAMVLSHFGYNYSPLDVAYGLQNIGMFAYEYGRSCRPYAIIEYAPTVGLGCYRVWSADEMAQALSSGAAIDMTIPYGSAYHQIAAVGLDSNYNTTVYDPLSGVYTQNVYTLWGRRAFDDENYAVTR